MIYGNDWKKLLNEEDYFLEKGLPVFLFSLILFPILAVMMNWWKKGIFQDVVILVWAVLFTAALIKYGKMKCPRCGNILIPLVKKPKSYREAFLGDRCPNCGLELKVKKGKNA